MDELYVFLLSRASESKWLSRRHLQFYQTIAGRQRWNGRLLDAMSVFGQDTAHADLGPQVSYVRNFLTSCPGPHITATPGVLHESGVIAELNLNFRAARRFFHHAWCIHKDAQRAGRYAQSCLEDGRTPEAIRALTEVVRLHKANAQTEQLALALFALADVYMTTKRRHYLAGPCLEEATGIVRKLVVEGNGEFRASLCRLLSDLAIVYWNEETSRAIHALRESIRNQRAMLLSGEHWVTTDLAISLSNLATLQARRDKLREARHTPMT